MPRHSEQKTLPFSPQQMFGLIGDVARYPEFLPWCMAARVYGESESGFKADLVIGFKLFKERFTSDVTLKAPGASQPGEIHVDYVKGPMKYLHNDWVFADDGSGGCRVDFRVDFEFKSKLLERLIGHLFEEAVHRMVMAFEIRAGEIYR